METIGIPPGKHETYENEERKPLSAGKSSEVSMEIFQKAHLYVIHNTDEILPYIERHTQVLKTENPGKRIAFLENEHNKSFAKWLREELADRQRNVSETVKNEYKNNGRFWGSKSGCNESDVKPYWKDIKKAKACMLAKAQASDASSKAKVEARGSKAKLQASTKTLIVKSQQDLWSEDTMTFAKENIRKRKLRKIIDISSDSSDDRRWAAKKASAPVFYGPSTQGLLDAYGYNTIEEYLSWNYFPSTDNESTDMENHKQELQDRMHLTRPKKYSELSATEAIQADCDIKATNIILQGLPPEVYALVSNHKVAKELWERIQLLMQGTSLTKQERECKLYDEFDKFAYKKGETLRDFYLRFSLLLNDMNIYNMKLEQFQVNTKFLNTLPPEWSKFVTDVKLVRDLHTTNIDQLHAYLGQHEFHANEVRLMHERNSDPLALYESPYQSQQYSNNQSSTSLSITYPSNDYQSSSVHHNVYSPSSSIPQLEYAPSVNQQPEFPQPDSGLIIPVSKQGDNPIDAINHMMSFLSAVVTSRYPTTNNQLRNSSNHRQQATINDGKVTLQPLQGRQISVATGTTRTYTPTASGSNSGK
ncbi:hypothetical protein Tco_0868942 [Tanacetum coccineum]